MGITPFQALETASQEGNIHPDDIEIKKSEGDHFQGITRPGKTYLVQGAIRRCEALNILGCESGLHVEATDAGYLMQATVLCVKARNQMLAENRGLNLGNALNSQYLRCLA